MNQPNNDYWYAVKDEKIANLETDINRLRRDCAEAYQVIGAMAVIAKYNHRDIARVLDNLSAAANDEPRPHEDLLPWPK